jgi:crotonobetainyl-CoA:carnitine CoA-transferase CaiB-like acyl-CoA transferase
MVLADFGAEVIRVDRIEGNEKKEEILFVVFSRFFCSSFLMLGGRRDFLSRGKKSIQVDLKSKEGEDLGRGKGKGKEKKRKRRFLF